MGEENKHSHIGASSAYRWMNCPGSVRLYGQVTRRAPSEYARVGTAAHEICERCLLRNCDAAEFIGTEVEVEGVPVPVDEGMAASVQVYLDKIRADQDMLGGTLLVEQSFDLSWVRPGMFGRNDACLVPDDLFGTLRVYDYKNGRKHVSAEGNTQCMYYALGALGEDNPRMVEVVACTIIQPNAYGKDPIDSWEVPVEDLYRWAGEELGPAVDRTKDPDAPCVEGDWCCFCEAAGVCPAKLGAALALLDEPKSAGVLAELPAVDALTPAQIGMASAFFTSDAFNAWVKSLAATELDLLQRGVEVPGRKLVETTSYGNRKWADPAAVTSHPTLSAFGEELIDSRLKSPAQVERLMTQARIPREERAAIMDSLVTREETTKISVVSSDDSRAAIDGQAAINMLD